MASLNRRFQPIVDHLVDDPDTAKISIPMRFPQSRAGSVGGTQCLDA
jgi:hypothetical protein